MKKILTLIAWVSFLTFYNSLQAQDFRVGLYSGASFSNLNGNLQHDKWPAKPGSTAGLMLNYMLNERVALQAEVGLISYYYKQFRSYEAAYPDDIFPMPTGSLNTDYGIIGPPMYVPANQSRDYQFLRVPLMLKYKTPTRLELELGAGMFYSFLINDEFTGKDRDLLPPTQDDQMDHYDWGYLFSVGISYPLTSQLSLFVDGRYAVGLNEFFPVYEGKNEGSELNFGIRYALKSKKTTPENGVAGTAEDLGSRWRAVPRLAYNLNSIRNKSDNHSYESHQGFSAGLSLSCRLGNGLSMMSDVLFDRRGYRVEGESPYVYRLVYADYFGGYKKVDTKVDLDYLSLPVYFRLGYEDELGFFIDVGAYVAFMMNATSKGDLFYKYADNNNYRYARTYVYDAVEGDFNNKDAGWLVGMGYRLELFHAWVLSFETRYTHGVLNILDEKLSIGYEGNEKFRNSSLTLSAGLCIPLF
ncbi:outer membrane beta-barrel protein [Sunxiuqinia sp. sy24]|uniref:outer membrane beta-barrel protein n=1 Tax=Sunxiuqinia sp. sy24 TaxID=3461495 RepID=UPI0040466093